MTTGILKLGTVLVNKIATGICDSVSLSQTTKCFRNQYNKKDFFKKLFRGHMNSVKSQVCHDNYILFDGSDIQKRFAKMMEAICEVDSIIDKDVTRIFDRGMNRPICRDFIIAG